MRVRQGRHRSRPPIPPTDYRVTLRTIAGDTRPVPVRLRWLLRLARRFFGLWAVSVEEVGPDGRPGGAAG